MRNEGKEPLAAIRQACLLRLRPILMTTMAALLGALPLMLGWGMGAELRRPLGVTMVGGLIVSQVLTLFTTPVIYLWFDRLSRRVRGRGAAAAGSGGAASDAEDTLDGGNGLHEAVEPVNVWGDASGGDGAADVPARGSAMPGGSRT